MIQAPNGAYFLASKIAKNRIKSGTSFLDFEYMQNGKDGIHIKKSKRFPHTTFQTKGKGFGRPYLYPSIVFRVLSRGIQ